MIMADVLKIFLLVLGALIVLISYWLASEALFPRVVARASETYRKHPLRNLLLGVLLGMPLAVGGFQLAQAGAAAGKATGFFLMALSLFSGLLGSAGLCRRIGDGLPSTRDSMQPWLRIGRGGVVLSGTFLLPFIGWFMVLPGVLLSGVGAALLAGIELRLEARASRAPQPQGAAP